ncbi:hypothetical protein GP486_004766 [Trichoglossum hirsutum]|uniref:Uncharacterized protein n=1 Tax=Trichoglossum hirsutum TaxID=265104 RepID=A0A9P8RNH4_9PEZI|nr:hypothetical protein GP486_004766 [Trichoglossum hirsutum]
MAALDTPAEPPLPAEEGPKPSSHTRRAMAPSGRLTRRSSRKHSPDTDKLADSNPTPTPSMQNLDIPPNPGPMEEQLARLQTFCVYASNLVDGQREDINRVSAAVERIETELKSFRGFLEEVKRGQRATHREQKSNGMTSEELDLLASSMGEIGRKANEVDTLKLELAMMKGKIRRLEDAIQQPTTRRPRHSQQRRSYSASTSSLSGSDDDDDSITSVHSPDALLSSQHSRGRLTAGEPVRRHGRPRHNQTNPTNPLEAPLWERDGSIAKNTNGHRISSSSIGGIRDTTSRRIRKTRSKPSAQASNRGISFINAGESDVIRRYGLPQPQQQQQQQKRRKLEKDFGQDRGEGSNQEDAIRARERVLDEEWRKDYWSEDQRY